LTILLRKRISRHIDHCAICGERRQRELSPAMLLGALPLPLLVLPTGLRGQVLRLVSSDSPADASHRERIVRRTGKFRHSGFPVQVSPAAAARFGRRPRAGVLILAAALILLAGGGFTTFYLVSHGNDAVSRHSVAATARRPAITRLRASAPPGAASSSPSATPGPPSPAPTSPSTSAPGTVPAAAASTSPARSAPPPAASLTVVTAQPVPLQQVPTAGPPVDIYTGSFAVTATGGPVNFTFSEPGSEKTYYTIGLNPASGTLDQGQQLTIAVTVTQLTQSGGMPYVTVTYPGQQAAQTVEFSLPGPPPIQ
jgi:hypothetical protein